MTPDQQEIMTINDNINSIKRHLDKIKVRQDDDDLYRIEQSRKLDLIVNALTDTDFNGRNGHLSRFNKIEVMVLQHEMYWKLLITIIISSGIIAGILKFLLP
jgi:hypothetical protein